jgi:hypothetical protein
MRHIVHIGQRGGNKSFFHRVSFLS